MRWLFLIWLSLLIIYNPFFAQAYIIDTDTKTFGVLRLGMSMDEVQEILKKNRTFLQDDAPSNYEVSLPIYDLLSVFKTAKPASIDIPKARIYYDDEVFFDLRKLDITNPEYHFFYKNPYYIVEFPSVTTYQVSYASRLNPLLYSLQLKFIKDKLYAIEYSADLSDMDFRRFQNNYYSVYNRIITPGDQTVEKDGVYVLLHVENQSVHVIKTDKELRNSIYNYLNSMIGTVVNSVYDNVQNILKDTQNAKITLLENKKKNLQKSLWEKYHSIDEL